MMLTILTTLAAPAYTRLNLHTTKIHMQVTEPIHVRHDPPSLTHPGILYVSPLVDVPQAIRPALSIAIIPEQQQNKTIS